MVRFVHSRTAVELVICVVSPDRWSTTGRTTVRRQWSLRLVTALVVGGVLVSGCSTKHEASSTLPDPSSSPTTAQGLPPLGPPDFPVPTDPRPQDAAGVAAFTAYFITL